MVRTVKTSRFLAIYSADISVAMGVRDAVAGNEGGTNQQPRSNVVLTLGAAMQVARAREMATANNE